MDLPILVVEDDYANQKVASLFLKKLGYTAEIAENGKKAIEMAAIKPYQLIFMDCQMPVVDGFEATRRIRSGAGLNQETPIVALTANVVNGIEQDCQNAGMNDLLSKPVHLANIEQILQTWLVPTSSV